MLTPWGARNQLTHVRAWAPLRSVTRSRAFPLLVWSERRRAGQRFRVDDCYGWPTGAPHDRTAPRVNPALGSAGQHVSVDVRRRAVWVGTLLFLSVQRPLFPNLLVTGVLVRACLGTCVWQLTSLLATQRPDRDSSQITPARTLPSLVLRVRNHTQTHLHIHTNRGGSYNGTNPPPPLVSFPSRKAQESPFAILYS